MTQFDSPHSSRRSLRTGNGQLNNQEIHDHGSKIAAYIALLVAGMAIMGMVFAIYVAREAKNDARVATMRVEGMTRAMIAHGIKDTYPHISGEDD